ncbi:hypothetical protein M758_UG246300 [Ceratodon purpureus]|nr:hypothetical protein M758_UG246300 [Ceratodon purpureus]KAG0596358.1 hypothetical protein M758_UG246300 [Ceratodon purpureus]
MPRARTHGRLPIYHLARQSDRDKKLLGRELTRARAVGLSRLKCPCRICNMGIKTSLSLATVAKHVRNYGYHPWQRGSSERYESNVSDMKWDDHIRKEYGEIAVGGKNCNGILQWLMLTSTKSCATHLVSRMRYRMSLQTRQKEEKHSNSTERRISTPISTEKLDLWAIKRSF